MRVYIIVAMLFLGLLGLNSCSQKHSIDETSVKDIRLANNTEGHIIKDLCVDFIQLETTEDNTIGVVEQIESYDDDVFLLEASQKRLLVFDTTGRYKNKIGNLGQGPGEYLMPISFSVSPKEKTISILDKMTSCILTYSLEALNLIETSPMPFNSNSFEKISKNNLFWSTDEHQVGDISNFNFAITSTNGNILETFLEKPIKSGYTTGPSKTIYKINDTLRFYRQFDPHIYTLTGENKSTMSYRLIMEDIQFPSRKFLQKISAGDRNYFDDLADSESVSYHAVFESKNNICINYIANNIMYLGLYDKSNGYTICRDWAQLETDLGIKGLTYIAGTIGDYFVVPLFIEQLKEHQQLGYKYNGKLSEILSHAADGDNPILLLFKLN